MMLDGVNIYHVCLTEKDNPNKRRWDIVYAVSRELARKQAQARYPDCRVGVLTKREFESPDTKW